MSASSNLTDIASNVNSRTFCHDFRIIVQNTEIEQSYNLNPATQKKSDNRYKSPSDRMIVKLAARLTPFTQRLIWYFIVDNITKLVLAYSITSVATIIIWLRFCTILTAYLRLVRALFLNNFYLKHVHKFTTNNVSVFANKC